MDRTQKFLTTLASQENDSGENTSSTTEMPVLWKLEAFLNQIEEDCVSYRPSTPRLANVRSIDETNKTVTSRRPSFSFLEQFLDNVDEVIESRENANTKANTNTNAVQEPPSVTKQIFFDCDNTLVDTESVAVEACSIVVNKCLAEHNVSVTFTVEELLIDYFGYTARKMVTLLSKMYNFSITPAEVAAYATYEEDLVINLIHANPLPCDGIERLLQYLQAQGRYSLSVVSSSPIRRIRAALEAAGIAKYFAENQVFSAKSSMPVPKSKPDPAIYNFAMAYNRVHPWQCVAFEDSRSGARSAILADIPCVAYLGTYTTPTQQEQVGATLIEEGCQEIMKSWSQALGCLERAEKAAATDVAKSLEQWEDLDEKRRQYRMLLGQLLLNEGRKTESKVRK